MVLGTEKILLGAIITVIGLVMILFSSVGGGINAGNLIVGFSLIIIGLIIAGNDRIENTADNEITTQSSNERKTTDGNHVTIEEEIITRTVKNESRAVM